MGDFPTTTGTRDGVEPSPRSLVDRVLALLGAFDDGEALSRRDLSNRTGLPKTTVHRLVRVLVEHRVLDETNGRLTIGVRLFELGRLGPHQELREVSAAYMQDLFATTREIVHLGVLDEAGVLYLEKISGHNQRYCPSRVGGRMPPHCTSLGKALLAFSPRDVVDRVLDQNLERRTPYTIVSRPVLFEDLRRVRALGTAFDHEETKLGLICVAAPVLNRSGQAVAAISVSAPIARADPKSLSYAVKTATLGLSRTLDSSQLRAVMA